MTVTRLRLPEFAAELRTPHGREAFSTEQRVAAVVVELVAPHRVEMDPVAFRDAVAELATVVVAVRSEPHPVEADTFSSAFDVVVPASEPGSLDEVLEGISRTPLAATTLAMLLRGSEERTLNEGLLAESMAYSLLQAGPEFADWRRGRPVRNRPLEIGPAVLAERTDAVLHLTLARPHVHNAFSARLRDGLVQALDVAFADRSVERIVLDGAGPSFCSGGDLDEFGSFPDPAEAHVIRLTRHAGRAIALLADRVEVHIHGATMGSGIELAAFASRVVAASDVRIALPELGLGLIPGAGGTVSLPRRIGRQRTALLALTGRTIDAPTALDWGLVDAISE